MPPKKYIPLFPNPPDPPRQPLDNGYDSDFPPCRIHPSTPDPPTPPTNIRKSSRRQCSSLTEPEVEPSPRRSLRTQPPKTGLGAKNIINTVQITVEQAKEVPKLLFKRRLESIGNDCPLKRQCLDDDTEWLEKEIDGIKEHMMQMDKKLDEILDAVKTLTDIEI